MTETAARNLGRSITVGAIWMLAVRLSIKGLGLVSSVILARLLMPEDFGIVALAASVYAFIRLLRDFGFGFALIQNQDSGEAQYDTAWTLQVILSVMGAVFLLGVAPMAAEFYTDDRLQPVLLALSLMFLITGFENIGIIDFQKHMNFDKVFWLNVIPKLVSFVATISLAFYLRNYWALLLGMMINKLMTLFLSYTMQGYRPRFSLAAWRQIIGFSSWLMINNLIKYLSRHGQNIVLAKFGGAPMVGLLSVSSEFASIVSMEIVEPINTAAYPGYAKVSQARDKLRATFIDVIGVVAALAIPGGLGLVAVTPLFVPVLLGDKWLAAIEVIPWISGASVFMSLMLAFDMVFMAIAQQRITTLLVTLRLLVFFPLMFVLLESDGAPGVAKAVLVSNLVVFPLYLMMLRHFVEIPLRALMITMSRPLVASVAMYAATAHYVGYLGMMELSVTGLAALVSAVLLGLVVFLLASLLLWKLAGTPDGVERRVITIARARLGALLNGG